MGFCGVDPNASNTRATANRKFDPTLSFLQQHNGFGRPQRKVEFELLGMLVRDQVPNPFFLLSAERAATALRTPPASQLDTLQTIVLGTATIMRTDEQLNSGLLAT